MSNLGVGASRDKIASLPTRTMLFFRESVAASPVIRRRRGWTSGIQSHIERKRGCGLETQQCKSGGWRATSARQETWTRKILAIAAARPMTDVGLRNGIAVTKPEWCCSLLGRIDNYQCELKLNRVGRRAARYDSLLSASSGGGYTGARTIGVQTNWSWRGLLHAYRSIGRCSRDGVPTFLLDPAFPDGAGVHGQLRYSRRSVVRLATLAVLRGLLDLQPSAFGTTSV